MNDHVAETIAKSNLDELKRVGIIAQKQKDTFLIRLRTVAGDMTPGELTDNSGGVRKIRKRAGAPYHSSGRGNSQYQC